jgi:peptidoglycan/LPS O-acetylase OafA/YrhL
MAVLLVLLFHSFSFVGISIFSGGFIGVDLFFVISGFLITGLLLREYEETGRVSFSRFYARRIRRILPAALFVILLSLLVSFILLPPLSQPSALLDGIASALSIGNIRFAITTNYFNQTGFSPFVHFWSLGVEEQFYLVWPALLVGAAWLGRRLLGLRGSWGIAIMLGLVVVTSLLGSLMLTNYSPTMAFYFLPTRAWQLALGGLLAFALSKPSNSRLVSRHFHKRTQALCAWIGLVILLYFSLALDFGRPTQYPGVYALSPTLVAVLLIAVGSNLQGPGILFETRPLRFLGKISYSLYLWHWPVLMFGTLLLAGPLAQTISLAQAVFLALISIVLSTFSWAFIEEPARRGQMPVLGTIIRLPRPGRLIAGGVAAMVIVAVCGSQLYWHSNVVIAGMTSASSGGAPNSYSLNSSTTPSLTQASNDYEMPILDGCYGTENVSLPPFDKCVYGNKTGSYTVALIGDSHASDLFPAMDFVAQKQSWKLVALVKSGCRFSSLRLYDYFLEREYAECAAWNEQIVAYLKSNPANLVVISLSHYDVNLEAADQGYLAQAQGLAAEIGKLLSTTRVVIVVDPPLPGKEFVPVCLSVYPADYRRCAFSSSASGNDIGAREAAAAKISGAGILDLTDQICPGTGDCPAVINNMIVWRDNEHLTATFSRSLGPVLDQRIVQTLSGSSQP